MSLSIDFECDVLPDMEFWRPRPLDIPSTEYWTARLTCQGCRLPLTPPVFYCQSHGGIHGLCNYCTSCSSCGNRIGTSRCWILEKILAVTKFKCQYGCKRDELFASEYRVHVKRCHLRPMPCTLCSERIPFREYFAHLRYYHRISLKSRDMYGNFIFDDFASQAKIEYCEIEDKVIFFRYESTKFWAEILSEDEDAGLDYYCTYEVKGAYQNKEGSLKFLNARSSHEGTLPSAMSEGYNIRQSVRSIREAADGLQNFIIPPTQGELFLSIVCEDDNSISSIASFESEWDVPSEQSDRIQNYVRRLVDDVTDLLEQKRSSLAHVSVPDSLMRKAMSIPEYPEDDDGPYDVDEVTPVNSLHNSYTKTAGRDKDSAALVTDPALMAKHTERRSHILNEIITTERNYVRDMEEILTGYGEEATVTDVELFQLLPPQLHKYTQSKEAPIGDMGFEPTLCFKQILLGNLDEIFNYQSTRFLPELELAYSLNSLQDVGRCFLNAYQEFLALYSRYCQMLPAVAAVRREIGEDHPWLELCRQKLRHRLSLDAYLMKPVQRITKYQLLLKDLMKYSEGVHGYSTLYEALSQMLEVLRSVDESMMQLNIVDYPYRLEEEGPMRLQASFLLWTESDRLRSSGHFRHLFLYARSIVICKKDRFGANDSALHFKYKLNLTDVGLTEKPKGIEAQTIPLTFELWTPKRASTFLLQAETPESRDLWVENIKNILMEQFKSAHEKAARKFSTLSSSSSFNSKTNRVHPAVGRKVSSLSTSSSFSSMSSASTLSGNF